MRNFLGRLLTAALVLIVLGVFLQRVDHRAYERARQEDQKDISACWERVDRLQNIGNGIPVEFENLQPGTYTVAVLVDLDQRTAIVRMFNDIGPIVSPGLWPDEYMPSSYDWYVRGLPKEKFNFGTKFVVRPRGQQ